MGTIAIAVASGTTTLLSLTAAQVTGLAALKLLGVSAGLLLSRRGKREEATNQISDTSLLTLTSTLEPEECFQLLFCTLATQKVKIDPDVENIHKLVTSKPGKYREAHKFGKMGKDSSIRAIKKHKENMTFSNWNTRISLTFKELFFVF